VHFPLSDYPLCLSFSFYVLFPSKKIISQDVISPRKCGPKEVHSKRRTIALHLVQFSLQPPFRLAKLPTKRTHWDARSWTEMTSEASSNIMRC